MKRLSIRPRSNFAVDAARLGFTFASSGGEAYWNDQACYMFSLKQIENDVEAAAHELHGLCMELVGKIFANDEYLTKMRIPEHAWHLIAKSWKKELSLYGRFDLSYDGKSPPKLLEYNADTLTSLFESAVVQWYWLEDIKERGDLLKTADQFNSLHERLVARWLQIVRNGVVHCTGILENEEDKCTIDYIRSTAQLAGLSTNTVDISQIKLDRLTSRFLDSAGRRIDTIFKLYPLEWLFNDDFGREKAMFSTQFIEPAWKIILSNKGLLPMLWEMAPRHPNLLPCFFEGDPRASELSGAYVRKPIYGREGANITIVDNLLRIEGQKHGYGAEGFVIQGLHRLPQFDNRFPVLGAWMVGDDPAGLGIREDITPITTNRAQFVPHAIMN